MGMRASWDGSLGLEPPGRVPWTFFRVYHGRYSWLIFVYALSTFVAPRGAACTMRQTKTPKFYICVRTGTFPLQKFFIAKTPGESFCALKF